MSCPQCPKDKRYWCKPLHETDKMLMNSIQSHVLADRERQDALDRVRKLEAALVKIEKEAKWSHTFPKQCADRIVILVQEAAKS